MAPLCLDDFTHREAILLLQIIEQSKHLQDRAGFQSLFNGLRKFVPFTYGACGIVTLQSLHFEVTHHNYPIEFAHLYATQGMVTEPALYELSHTHEWMTTSEDVTGLDRRAIDAAKAAFGIQNCLSVAVRGQLGFCFYLAVSNFPEQKKGKLLRALKLIAPTFHPCCLHVTIPMEVEQAQAQAIAQRLTEREKEVLVLMMAGKTSREIGVTLKITERTVRFHLEALHKKYGGNPRDLQPKARVIVAETLKLRGFDEIESRGVEGLSAQSSQPRAADVPCESGVA
jgi:DNA-binding CsgD family transcriptional regulator